VESATRLEVKPLSVNECWQGQRFKTKTYKDYEKKMLYMLKAFKLPAPPYKVTITWGFSNITSDIDNPCKPLLDILQKKYNFNDRHIMELNLKKTKTHKGCEFIEFLIESLPGAQEALFTPDPPPSGNLKKSRNPPSALF
jgi:Holliday junction resolvase RusA-like endonuclease